MTLSLRLNLLFFVAAIFMGSLVAIISAFDEYDAQLHSLTENSSARLLSHPEIQLLVYRRDSEKLQQVLKRFLNNDALTAAIVYSSLGDNLAQQQNPQARTLATAPFDLVRGELLTVDQGLVTPDGLGGEIGKDLVSTLLNRDAPLYLSLPVFASLNPGVHGLTAKDFGLALASGDNLDSQWVIGYLHLVIDRAQLLGPTWTAMGQVLLLTLLIASVVCLLTWLLTQQITRPLQQLTAAADEVAAGRFIEPIELDGSSELREVGRVFNSVIGGLSNSRNEHNTDKHLLSMKVEERSSQLSVRSQELTKAVEEVAETRSKLHHLANYDNLTSLPNRRLFTEQLDLLLRLNKRNRHMLALLFIDFEGFKRLNDSLGLRAGDQLLTAIARRLMKCLRDSDRVGHFISADSNIGVSRLGGEEFTVVLNQVDNTDSVGLVAQRLIEVLEQPLDIDGHSIVVKPCLGIAMAPTNGMDVETLLRAASTAKMKSKESGTPYVFYSRELETAGETRIKMESELRKAIERNELILHYQPQIDTHSGSVVGAEALLRWQHSEMGLVPPARFISMAEEIGVMNELGDWVLVEACRQVKTFSDEGIKLPKVAINVSAEQFNSAFVIRVSQVLQETGIEAAQLELGLTEAIMTSNEQDTIEALSSLKKLGVYLAVDDFGTGYSPISYLSRHPLDELKIDRSFLLESSRSENGAKLVIAIIAMAKSMGLRVLASGVETEAEFHFLTGNGAHVIQGYLFSKPVTGEELKPMLKPWHFIDQVQKLDNSNNGVS